MMKFAIQSRPDLNILLVDSSEAESMSIDEHADRSIFSISKSIIEIEVFWAVMIQTVYLLNGANFLMQDEWIIILGCNFHFFNPIRNESTANATRLQPQCRSVGEYHGHKPHRSQTSQTSRLWFRDVSMTRHPYSFAETHFTRRLSRIMAA